jgi:hypothetical protein
MLGAMSGSAMVMIANSLRGARWMEVYQIPSPAYVARMSAFEIPPSSAEWRMWARSGRSAARGGTSAIHPTRSIIGDPGNGGCRPILALRKGTRRRPLLVSQRSLIAPASISWVSGWKQAVGLGNGALKRPSASAAAVGDTAEAAADATLHLCCRLGRSHRCRIFWPCWW